MNAVQMTKQQKLKLVFIALGIILIVGLLYRFAVVPLAERHAEAVERRDELKASLEKADIAIRDEVKSRRQSEALKNELEKFFEKELPQPDSALAWASQAINAQARQMKLEIGSIVEDLNASAGWDNPDLAKRIFKPYAVRVEFSCSFDKARSLVRSLQQSNPCLTMASVAILANTQEPEKPGVVMVLEWPSWKDPKRAAKPFVPVEQAKEKKDANQHV